jgi:rhodanese-related sulfurtransferase
MSLKTRIYSLVLIVLFFIGVAYLLRATFFHPFLKVLIPDHTVHMGVNELERLDTDTLVRLDTRSYEEYAVSHIKGASWVGFEAFMVEKIDSLPKDTTIVLYCSIGYRSDIVGKKLQEKGYQHVYNLWGGIFAWINQGNLVFSDGGVPTTEIHPYSPLWGFWLTKGEKTYHQKKSLSGK